MAASTFSDECQDLFNTTNLYSILGLETENTNSLTEKEIKRAYYKCSLKYHPDRVQNEEAEDQKRAATRRFQILGKAYAILSDQEKRKIYDETGAIDEGGPFEDDRDWMAYWRILFKKVTVKDIENFKKKYKGSDEELNDLKVEYLKHEGEFELICENAFFVDNEEDRERIRGLLQQQIDEGQLTNLPKFERQESQTQKKRRLRKAQKEVLEAKQMLKHLTGKEEMQQDDLVNAIAQRSADRAKSFFQQLEEKYGNPSGTSKTKQASKKRKVS